MAKQIKLSNKKKILNFIIIVLIVFGIILALSKYKTSILKKKLPQNKILINKKINKKLFENNFNLIEI